jgi:hypothetical protein
MRRLSVSPTVGVSSRPSLTPKIMMSRLALAREVWGMLSVKFKCWMGKEVAPAG